LKLGGFNVACFLDLFADVRTCPGFRFSSWLESGSVGGSSILDRTDTASTLAFVVAAFARTRMCPAHARHQIPAGGSEEIEKLPRMPWPAGR
jgi:hypothetical protein